MFKCGSGSLCCPVRGGASAKVNALRAACVVIREEPVKHVFFKKTGQLNGSSVYAFGYRNNVRLELYDDCCLLEKRREQNSEG